VKPILQLLAVGVAAIIFTALAGIIIAPFIRDQASQR